MLKMHFRVARGRIMHLLSPHPPKGKSRRPRRRLYGDSVVGVVIQSRCWRCRSTCSRRYGGGNQSNISMQSLMNVTAWHTAPYYIFPRSAAIREVSARIKSVFPVHSTTRLQSTTWYCPSLSNKMLKPTCLVLCCCRATAVCSSRSVLTGVPIAGRTVAFRGRATSW